MDVIFMGLLGQELLQEYEMPAGEILARVLGKDHTEGTILPDRVSHRLLLYGESQQMMSTGRYAPPWRKGN